MAARATRSATHRARVAEAVATGTFGALSHDELGVIVDGLADPLQPVVAVALSSTCLGLRTPLQAALEVLKERHEKAKALCRKLVKSCAEVRGAERLYASSRLVADDEAATLGMILRTKGLPRLQELYLRSNGFGDAAMHVLCEGLGRGAAPSLRILSLADNKFGPAGAEALAAALGRGAFPKIDMLSLGRNPIGNQGATALASPLRKLPAFQALLLDCCEICDEGVASLVDNLGKDDFKKLEILHLSHNQITDAGMVKIVAAIDAGGLPKIHQICLGGNPASGAACRAVSDAVAKRIFACGMQSTAASNADADSDSDSDGIETDSFDDEDDEVDQAEEPED